MSDTRPVPKSVVTAARRHLCERLSAVRDRLSKLAESDGADPEHVHKFRVATRRATAAVRAFADYLPQRVARGAKRTLRDMRRAAGEARDWDVFAAHVIGWAVDRPDAERPGLDALLGWAAAKRDSARVGLDALRDDHPHAAERLIERTVDAVRRPRRGKRSEYRELADRLLAGQRAELSASLAGDDTDDAHLHQIRVCGKRARYTSELFADCLPAEQRQTAEADLKELQELLGRFHDGVVAGQHLTSFTAHFQAFHPAVWERLRIGADVLAEYWRIVRETERERFREWRQQWGNRAQPSTTEESDRLG